MPRCKIYLDESGDLGFKFDAPYRAGGSSRHLTLAAAICEGESQKHVKRFMADFARDQGASAKCEVKWVDLDQPQRVEFARRARKLTETRQEIYFASITVYKPRVQAHIRSDPNKLYNYMIGLMLLPFMEKFDQVQFYPDARSIKVKSGNSLHDYLQTQLWFERKATTELETLLCDSSKIRALQFTDYISGVFQSFYEDGLKEPRDLLEPVALCKRLYFPP